MADRNETVYVDDVVALNRTANGGLWVLVENEEICIPESQIREDSEVAGKGDKGTLAIPRWLAEDRGML